MACILGKPKPSPARLLAFELVMQVNQEGAFANIRLPELLSKSKLDLSGSTDTRN